MWCCGYYDYDWGWFAVNYAIFSGKIVEEGVEAVRGWGRVIQWEASGEGEDLMRVLSLAFVS